VRTVDGVLVNAAPGFEELIAARDINDDNLLCYLELPESVTLFEPVTFFCEDNKFGGFAPASSSFPQATRR
jgi:hypothetical protein